MKGGDFVRRYRSRRRHHRRFGRRGRRFMRRGGINF